MTAARLNGCHNRPPFATHYKVGVRPAIAGGVIFEVPVMQANTGSKDCHYTHTALGQADPGCAKCIHRVAK